MRKVFLDELPRKIYCGKEVIDWKKSVGYFIDFIYDDIQGKIKIINYENRGKNSYLGLCYKDRDIHYLSTCSLKKSNIGVVIGKIRKDFRYNIGNIVKNINRDLVIVDKFTINDNENCPIKHYKYKCNICMWDNGIISEYNLIKGIGCSCCSGRTVVEGINDIPTTAPWMVKFFQGGYDEAKLYTRSSNKKIYCVCPDCGKIQNSKTFINNLYKNKSIGCSCSDGISYPEKFILSLLSQLKIEFVFQLSKSNEKWCNNYRYDFAILNKSCIIEVHGGGHYSNSFSTYKNSKRTFEEELLNDTYKEKLAIQNGIKHYIIINAEHSNLEWIKKSIFDSKLPTLLNFTEDDIDWLKCEESSLSNLTKQVCEYKFNHCDLTTTEIGDIFKIDRHTVLEYLKAGTVVGWCFYDKEKEIKMKYKKALKGAIAKCSKPVEVFKDGCSLGVFISIKSLSDTSISFFGTKFYGNYISNVCKGKADTYKGYEFKYV